jgi:hypothetical protein
MTAAAATGHCGECEFFRNDAAYLEQEFKGLTALGSGYGSTRADDGICARHDRYLGARSSCADFSRRAQVPDIAI